MKLKLLLIGAMMVGVHMFGFHQGQVWAEIGHQRQWSDYISSQVNRAAKADCARLK